MIIKSILKTVLPVGLLLISGCSDDGGDNAIVNPGGDPNVPVLAPIGNQVLLNGTPFKMQLQATDPNGDALTFSWQETFGQLDTHSVFSPISTLNEFKQGEFLWTPTINTWLAANEPYIFTEKFIVSDTTQPSPLQDSEVVEFTVMNSEAGVLYMTHCGECHGYFAEGGVIPGTDITTTFLTGRVNSGNTTLTTTVIQDSINDTPEMQFLLDVPLSAAQIQSILDYINTLPII